MDIAIPKTINGVELSLDMLAIWLNTNMDHSKDDYPRWKIVNYGRGRGWKLWFKHDSDATLFSLLWSGK